METEHGEKKCRDCGSTENLTQIGSRQEYICPGCMERWIRSLRELGESIPPTVENIVEQLLGYLDVSVLQVGSVEVRDIFTDRKGEARYDEVITLLCEQAKISDPGLENMGQLLGPMEAVLFQVDLLLRWGMIEAIKLGLQLGRDPAALRAIEKAQN